jgi:hypothetical protein
MYLSMMSFTFSFSNDQNVFVRVESSRQRDLILLDID